MKAGDVFTANINGTNVIGKIQIQGGDRVYLCQDDEMGGECLDKLGYNYSWFIGILNAEVDNPRYYKNKLITEHVTDFVIVDRSL